MNVLYLETNGDSIHDFPIPLDVEEYGCGIVELNGKIISKNKKSLYLCCNICEESYVGNLKIPVIRMINRTKNGTVNKPINKIIWLKVTRPQINSIHLYISDENGEIASVSDCKLNCTLLFIPLEKKVWE